MMKLTRRSALITGASAVALPLLNRISAVWAEDALESLNGAPRLHGLSHFGDLALRADFKHFEYVNPAAPKGGDLSLQVSGISNNQNFSTFDSLNSYILKGNGAAGMDMIFDSLLAPHSDEPDSCYGLVASEIQISADRQTYRFFLRPQARFHDDSPLTAEDVAFSLNLLKEKGHPLISQLMYHFLSAEAEKPDQLLWHLRPACPRTIPLFLASLPIFSKAYYTKNPFDATSLQPPLGSSAYKVGTFEVGRYITFDRVPNYWGKDLPVNVGKYNFDRIRYQYFRDRSVAFEGFKSAVFTYRTEVTSYIWATGYDFPAVREGRVKKEVIRVEGPGAAQGWYFNLRRTKFKDVRVRQALANLFDFEWINKNIMYNLYERTYSFFQNSPLCSNGLPSAGELNFLEPLRGKIPQATFEAAYVPPVSDGSGQDRQLLKEANRLLTEAGCKREGTHLLLPNGERFSLEIFFSTESPFERHVSPFMKSLEALGIEAEMRIVDAVQFQKRLQTFDYDMVIQNFGTSMTPGEELWDRFGSRSAHVNGSYNSAGLEDPNVDYLIGKIAQAEDRQSLTCACQALDRLLRVQHIWIPMWNNPNLWLAYWDIFSRPSRSAKYSLDTSTWWYDHEKANKIKFTGSSL